MKGEVVSIITRSSFCQIRLVGIMWLIMGEYSAVGIFQENIVFYDCGNDGTRW
jgi:hypothetical protein